MEYNFSPVNLHKMLAKNITPKFKWSKDVDINTHRKKAKEKLYELLGLDTFTKCDDNFKILSDEVLDGQRLINFIVQTELGYYANCRLLFPKNYSGEKLPLCLGLQGHVSGAHLSVGIKKYEYDESYINDDKVDFCIQATKRGFIGLALEQRGFGENGGDSKNGHTMCGHTSRGAILLGRTTIGERVWDVQRVLDAVIMHFSSYITLEGSILMGMSGGGTATYYTACLEDRFSIYVPCVAFSTFYDSIIDREHCECNYIPSILKFFDMGDMAVMIAPKRLLILSATEDRWFPYNSALTEYKKIEEIYSALNESNKCAFITGHGGHSYYENTWKHIQAMLNN